MKKVLFIVLVALFTFSCAEDECTQDCYVVEVGSSARGISTKGKVFVCHKGSTLEIEQSSLQEHLDHDDTEGKCETLSVGGLTYGNGINVEIACKYDLPFISTDPDTGKQYLYTESK